MHTLQKTRRELRQILKKETAAEVKKRTAPLFERTEEEMEQIERKELEKALEKEPS